MGTSRKLVSRAIEFTWFAAELCYETIKTAFNPLLTWPFLTGQPIISSVPHIKAKNPLGHLSFTTELLEQLNSAAHSTTKGIATYWAGPFLPVIYVATNKARHALIKEEHIGSINDGSEKYLRWLTRGNHVMTNFLAFMSVHSEYYAIRRKFLLRFFHIGVKKQLPIIDESVKQFLTYYAQHEGIYPKSLREFVNLLVLHTNSRILGYTEGSLDQLYLENEEYQSAINHIAHYGISEAGNTALEATLFNYFCEILKRNFEIIRNADENTDFIKCIYDSMGLPFPKTYLDFFKLPKNIQHNIAMSFASVILGGLIHSTVNTLDWALASLLKDLKTKQLLEELLNKYSELDLADESVFDKEGPLAAIGEWVLQNVYSHPAFPQEFFLNSKPSTAILPDETKVNIPDRGFIRVNYEECNLSNKEITTKPFSECLKNQSTTSRFIGNNQVASFGGSQKSRDNKKSRLCPGARTSLDEQMIIISHLLKYNFFSKDTKKISLKVDTKLDPLHSRVDEGEILLALK